MLGSGAELDAAQPGERDESIPYGSYRLKIHAQPKQYLTLGGYSFDYSTRVLVNGSKVLEIGKVGASAAESEPRIDYMLIPIYTGEDGKVEVVCQYANFVHREGGGLTQMHLSTAENIDRMRRSRNLYSLVLGGSLCLFGMYFLLFAVFQGEIKYVFLAVICALLGLRDQNFYVLHLLPANYNWAVAYRFLVLMITLQPCFLLLLLQSLYEKLAKPIVVRCYALLYLARHPNRSVSAQELYEAVWQQPMGADPHAVRMTISRLKQKLGGEDARVTVNSYRSSGYRLEEQ